MDRLLGRRFIRKGMQSLLAGLKYHVETGHVVDDRIPASPRRRPA